MAAVNNSGDVVTPHQSNLQHHAMIAGAMGPEAGALVLPTPKVTTGGGGGGGGGNSVIINTGNSAVKTSLVIVNAHPTQPHNVIINTTQMPLTPSALEALDRAGSLTGVAPGGALGGKGKGVGSPAITVLSHASPSVNITSPASSLPSVSIVNPREFNAQRNAAAAAAAAAAAKKVEEEDIIPGSGLVEHLESVAAVPSTTSSPTLRAASLAASPSVQSLGTVDAVCARAGVFRCSCPARGS
jgi:hypothetical protein